MGVLGGDNGVSSDYLTKLTVIRPIEPNEGFLGAKKAVRPVVGVTVSNERETAKIRLAFGKTIGVIRKDLPAFAVATNVGKEDIGGY